MPNGYQYDDTDMDFDDHEDCIHGWPEGHFTDEELENTPDRISRFREEWREKREYDKFTTFPNPGYDQMVTLKDIEFYSVCAHHLLPFTGHAHIAYIPGEEVLGISKLARIVDKFASRPQSQERLTHQIVDFMEGVVDPKGVMVVIEGSHQCMTMRGVAKQDSTMQTSAVRGYFAVPPTGKNPREEFLALLRTGGE